MLRTIQASIQLVFSEIFSLGFCLSVLCWIVRIRYGDRLSTMTLFYPANRKYIESVTFNWYAKRAKWKPKFGGLFVTEKGCGLIFAMGALEEEFAHPANRARLLDIHERMEQLAERLGIPSVAYSGVLPSVLAKAGVHREPIELTRTAHWIVEASEIIRKECRLPEACPVVVLGAAGYLGRRVVSLLSQSRPMNVLVEIDPEHQDARCHGSEMLTKLQGAPVLVINISRRDVLERYIDCFWKEVVVLNEVYPECSPDGLRRLKTKGIRYFHIQGIRAWSIPNFPGAYRGAVPCCAASAANSVANDQAFSPQLKLLEK